MIVISVVAMAVSFWIGYVVGEHYGFHRGLKSGFDDGKAAGLADGKKLTQADIDGINRAHVTTLESRAASHKAELAALRADYEAKIKQLSRGRARRPQ